MSSETAGMNDAQPAERVAFELDSNLINHLVYEQATTVEKALLELIMNAIDAGAPRVVATIHEHGFVVEDAGKGFSTRQDIDAFFARFGTAHQEGDATFGRYRIGRAQIMAYASTTWRSRQFEMSVDVCTDAQGFKLRESLVDVAGCRISGTWYLNRMGSHPSPAHMIESICAAVVQTLSYPPVEVEINGTVVPAAADGQWDDQDDLAYYQLTLGQKLSVFNQGVLVTRFDPYHHHIGGIVVSKRPLRVNMARNMIRSDCPHWTQILHRIKERGDKLHADSPATGTVAHRQYLLSRFLEGKADLDVKVVTVVPKKVISLREWLSELSLCDAISIADYGEIITGERVARAGTASVLHFEFLELLSAAIVRPNQTELHQMLDEFLGILGKRLVNESLDWRDIQRGLVRRSWATENRSLANWIAEIPIVPLSELDAGGDDAREISDDAIPADLAEELRIVQSAMFRFTCWRKRSLHLGTSSTAEAWTDGSSRIWLSRKHFRRWITQGEIGLHHMMDVLIHEYTHDDNSLNAGHDEEFYFRFHETKMEMASELARAMDDIRVARAELHGNPYGGRVWIAPANPPLNRNPLQEPHEEACMVYVMLDRLKDGECTIDEVQERVAGLMDDLNSSEWSDVDFVVRRFGLAPAVRYLFGIAPPDRLPGKGFLKELSTTSADIVFADLSINSRTMRIKVKGAAPSGTLGSPLGNVDHEEDLLMKVEMGRKGVSVQLDSGVPPSVLDSIRSEISSREHMFPWAKRQLERDLIWWMCIRTSWQPIAATEAKDNHLDLNLNQSEEVRSYGFYHRDFGAGWEPAVAAQWLEKLSAEADADLRTAEQSSGAGYFWRRWI